MSKRAASSAYAAGILTGVSAAYVGFWVAVYRYLTHTPKRYR